MGNDLLIGLVILAIIGAAIMRRPWQSGTSYGTARFCTVPDTFMDSPAIARNLAQSNFDARKLLTGKMSIYLILPPRGVGEGTEGHRI